MKHFIKIDNRNIIIGYSDKLPINNPEEWKEVNIEPSIQTTIWKYVDGKVLNTGQSIVPHRNWMIWDDNINSWIDPRTAEEKANYEWQQIRLRRNELLIESDWTDTLSAKNRLGDELYNAWQQYRQALRDVTNQADPFTITWPTAPQ